MKLFENVKIGYEIEFLNSKGKTENAMVVDVDDKKFSIEVLNYCKFEKEYHASKLSWFLSGKKTNRFYTYGDAKRVVTKWN